MSYHSTLAPQPPHLQGLGSLDPTPKSYYIALVETVDPNTNARSYTWTPYYYMGFWDMNSWSFTLQKDLPTGQRQGGKIYQWNGSAWTPTAIDETLTL